MNDREELLELHQLNIQLMDILLVIGERFLEYTKTYNVAIEERQVLSRLIGSATKLLEEISAPYRGNPIKPVEDRSPRDKLTEYMRRCSLPHPLYLPPSPNPSGTRVISNSSTRLFFGP